MAEPFLAEIRMFGFTFAPPGWAYCDGQILPINQNQSLYSLLGTTYGGDGESTFALPEMRGRVPVHVGPGYNQGQKGGVETVALSVAEMPTHTHNVKANSTDQDREDQPGNHLLCKASGNVYGDPSTPTSAMFSGSCTNTGNNQGHNNMQPYLAVGFCIAISGFFPSE